MLLNPLQHKKQHKKDMFILKIKVRIDFGFAKICKRLL